MPCLRNRQIEIDENSALFLDRDGVLNVRIPEGYVRSVDEFVFLSGAEEALAKLSGLFRYIFIVTNQQGIGKGLVSMAEVTQVHNSMREKITKAGGRIDKIYLCPDLKKDKTIFRKPSVGMGLQAKKDFPDIVFSKSIMVGDTRSDIEFGYRLGMHTVLIGSDKKALEKPCMVEKRFDNLMDFSIYLSKI